VISRNVVPVFGVLLLGWNAQNVLLLYYADTLLGIAVLFGALLVYYYRTEVSPRKPGVRMIVGLIVTGVILLGVFAFPLGIPLVFMLGGQFDWQAARTDTGFHAGLAWQIVAAFWSSVGLTRALRDATPEQLKVKRRFTLVMMRWLALIVFAFQGITVLLGRYSALFFVVVYAGISIWTEIAPDKFLRAMPGSDDKESDGRSGEKAEKQSAATSDRKTRRHAR